MEAAALLPVGRVFTFHGPYDQYRERIGQSAVVTGHVTEADGEHDAEVLPMYRVLFADGVEIEAWPEEVE